MDRISSYMVGISLDMCKVHLLLREADIRSNYHACHAGMRNRKMTRNVCITLGHMFPSLKKSPREIRYFLSFPKIREVVVGNLHLRRGQSICFSSPYKRARGLSISRKS